MHHSRLAGFIIDCENANVSQAAEFWSRALNMAPVATEGDSYVKLDGSARDLAIEVQRVSHESRVHLDIESDDVEAEVVRLQALGARRLENVRTWVVMEAPTGQRFCVIRAPASLQGAPGAQRWA